MKDLRKHRTQHQVKKNEKCTQCDYVSQKVSNIKKHFDAVHGNKYNCNECGKLVPIVMADKHKEKHSRKFECKICGKISKNKLDWHISNHYKNKEFAIRNEHNCDHCPYKSFRKYDLRRHIIRKHVVPSKDRIEHNKKCETCNYTFSSFWYLKTHIKNGCQGGNIIIVF